MDKKILQVGHQLKTVPKVKKLHDYELTLESQFKTADAELVYVEHMVPGKGED